ncbi:MAG: alkaline phosphatase D family protein [Planctomycetes bacterium]|nr:alkaline phosphatase D family protein [Planctomycetota bacterium]
MKPSAYLVALLALAGLSLGAAETRQAGGVKVGEVTADSALVWVRRTLHAERLEKGLDAKDAAAAKDDPKAVRKGACPGAPGKARVRYGEKKDLSDAQATDWVELTEAEDFQHTFALKDLKPAAEYFFATQTAATEGKEDGELRGRFRTAPKPDEHAAVTFTVITGQAWRTVDDSKKGHKIYESMLKLDPHFIVPTGDTVYYDNDPPDVLSPAMARFHWERLFSLPRLRAFFLRVPAYFEKDDHDTWCNDCWPTMAVKRMGTLTFETGQKIFRQQVPMSAKCYRTFRWGKGLQVWLTEGRDYRSPNTAEDGPEKTIWGAEQMAWLKQSLLESDADWKVLVSPTPIVGPDRGRGKRDNHANKSFQQEGDAVRAWFQEKLPKHFFVACGDRHWQYHSVHPQAKVQEFCCGPTTDSHAGGAPDKQEDSHKFLRVKGGFLSVSVTPEGEASAIAFRLHDVDGKVVYEYKSQP